MNSFSIQQQERKDKNKARLMAFLLFLLLMAILLFPFISGKIETRQRFEKVITIEFDDKFYKENASAAKSSAESAAAGGDNSTVEEEAKVEELAEEPIEEPIEEPMETLVEEIAEEMPVTEEIPEPTPEPAEAPTELVTADNDNPPVAVKKRVKESTSRSRVAKSSKKPTEKTKTSSSSSDDLAGELDDYFSKSKSRSNSSGSGSNSGNGTSDANGSGRSRTAGTGNSGSSSSGNSKLNGQGTGTSGDRFDGDGLLTRKVIKRADVESLIEKTGKIVINLCVNRDGAVVYSKVDRLRTTLKDPVLLKKAENTAKQYRYEKDYTVAERQCGKLSFIVDIEKEKK